MQDIAKALGQAKLARATPGLLCPELLLICCAESHSWSVVARATPGLLCRELLPVCCTANYFRFVVRNAENTDSPEATLLWSTIAEERLSVQHIYICYM